MGLINWICLLFAVYVDYKMARSYLRAGGSYQAYYYYCSSDLSFNDLICLCHGHRSDCVGFDFLDSLSDG